MILTKSCCSVIYRKVCYVGLCVTYFTSQLNIVSILTFNKMHRNIFFVSNQKNLKQIQFFIFLYNKLVVTIIIINTKVYLPVFYAFKLKPSANNKAYLIIIIIKDHNIITQCFIFPVTPGKFNRRGQSLRRPNGVHSEFNDHRHREVPDGKHIPRRPRKDTNRNHCHSLPNVQADWCLRVTGCWVSSYVYTTIQ